MTREEYECEWLKIFNGIEREKSEEYWLIKVYKDRRIRVIIGG